MNISFVMSGADALIRDLEKAAKDVERRSKEAMRRVGATVKDRAQDYAPISPTEKQKRAVSTATKAQWRAARKRRKASATSRPKPGALQNSIRSSHTADRAEIFVPANSRAGAYAYRIHSEKGKKWWKRGEGTRRKGDQADAKFIERAIFDSEDEIDAILRDELGRALPR